MRWSVLVVLMVVLAGCADGPSDSDGDGIDDEAERAAGSDPNDASSVPEPPASEVTPENATAPQWADVASASIRPGASLGGYCTFNFLYVGENQSVYIGTAAHCTDEPGERVSLGSGDEIGTVVYDSDVFEAADSLVDFSLIRLDDGAIGQAHPQMLAFDGPTGSATASDISIGDVIQIYGYGMVVGDNPLTRARMGILTDYDEKEYNVDMPAVYGDSGGPLLHMETGKAFGIVSRFGFDQTPPSTDVGPLMDFIYAELEKAGYGDVRVATI